MNHIFNPKHFKKLDSSERKLSLPSDIVLSHLDLKPGQIVADVGCGVGYFSFPMADVVGSKGAVKSFDISDIMVNELRKRVHNRDYQNIEVFKSTSTSTDIEDNSVDVFFTSNLLHELDDITQFTEKAIRTLKYNGKIAYLDFKKIATENGPPVEKRISEEYVVKLFEDFGLMDIVNYDINGTYYLIIGKKRK